MSATPKDANTALADLALALAIRKVSATEATAIQQTLLEKYGCKGPADLKTLTAEQCASLIDDAIVLAGKPLPLSPLYARIAVCLQALKAGECPAAYKDDVLRAMVATPDLDLTQEDELLGVLKSKLRGARIDSLRKEYGAMKRKACAPKDAMPKGAEFVLFREHASDTYYGGIYNPAADEWFKGRQLRPMKPHSIAQFCGQSGRPTAAPEQIPFGSFYFQPGAAPQLTETPTGYQANHWTLSEIRKKAVPSDVIPAAIRKVLLHVLGGDERVLDHFINWLAVAYQTHGRVNTSWLFTGRTGTGKGLAFDQIISPIWGSEYCYSMLAESLKDQFNGWAEHCLMLCINEAEAIGPELERRLRVYTTDPYIPVRAMQKALVMTPNYLNVIYATNSTDPLRITSMDRRTNVAPRQETPLEDGDPARLAVLAGQLRAELPQFAGYLARYPADAALASKPMKTEQRDLLIETSTSTPDRILQAAKNGDLDYLTDAFFENADGADDTWSRDYVLMHGARNVLRDWAAEATPAGVPLREAADVRASQLARMYNFLLADPKYTCSSVSMGIKMKRAGIKPGKRSDSHLSQAYPIQWRTKKTAEGLAKLIAVLEHPEKKMQEAFDAEPVVSPPKKSKKSSKPAAPISAAPAETDADVSWIDGSAAASESSKPVQPPAPAPNTATNATVDSAVEFAHRVELFKGLKVGKSHLGQITAECLAAVFPSLEAIGSASIEQIIASKSKGTPMTADSAASLRQCARDPKGA